MFANINTQDQVFNENGNQHRITHRDGSQVTVRPVRLGDIALIEAMHERLSKDSLYYRYLSPHKPTPRDLQKLCSTDKAAGTVLVATVDEPQEKVVGIACYQVDGTNPASAEPAILVEDDYQGCGLGKQIVAILCRYAIQRGVNAFVSYIHPVNHRVLQMIQGSGLHCEVKYDDGLKKVRVWLR